MDLPKCPKCGKDNRKSVSEWVGGAKTKEPMDVKRYICSSCGTSYVAWLDSKTEEYRIMTRKR
jgi:transposase-like protein